MIAGGSRRLLAAAGDRDGADLHEGQVVGIRRDDATVHVTLSTSPAVFEKLVRGLTR